MKAVAEQAVPFGAASVPRSLGDGTFTTTLRPEWSVGGHPHAGFLVALMARAAVTVVSEHAELASDPISISVEFLRAASLGPALLRTDVRKAGGQLTVVGVRLEQRGRCCVEATVMISRLPWQRSVWSELPVMPAEPPSNAIALSKTQSGDGARLTEGCEVRLDASTALFLAGRRPPVTAGNAKVPRLRLRLWVRPKSGPTDVYFALLAGDVSPPVPSNLGHGGFAPPVQLTALVRARPAPGWLRVHVDSRAVSRPWFDSDATVIDAAGQLVCQMRQLAVTPGR
ncbi:thioesterase family protein [Haloechinothrix halophila]|uniref:Uncharacterized protein, possibly involved in aromatic compounds catabolism n=1 Tax=Haloechinothrix halophila YIM 93223 TaxID=592678 RepID=W9DNM3_9PSEU|nr:uncharacterized protein, possibly involved in aromatic compounds catabolism [Haloechinothrix halophila YIM 93223]